jgi:clan AA aspartic protease
MSETAKKIMGQDQPSADAVGSAPQEENWQSFSGGNGSHRGRAERIDWRRVNSAGRWKKVDLAIGVRVGSFSATGLSFAMLTLKNPRCDDLGSVAVEALAETGSVYLVIPQHIQFQLGLEPVSEKEVTLADDSKRMVPYVGPLEVRFKNRAAFTGAIVMGDQVLLGAIPMEDMDLVVLPNQRRVDINPLNPNYAAALAK